MASTKKASQKSIQESLTCTCCGKEKTIKTGFYVSNSILYQNKNKIPVCKQCIWGLYDNFVDEANDDEQVALFRLCRLLDLPYLDTPFNSAVDEADKNGGNIFKLYMKNINSLKQYSSYTFENGDSLGKEEREEKEIKIIESNLTERDKQNEKDVISMLGYDPFDTENVKDRKYLFNRLVDMLDDSTLEDNLLLMSIIEIVKGFNQIDKINEMISTLTSDLNKLSSNNGGIKSLIDTKKNLMSTILKIAEDNGISTKFNTTKSKGAGTLAGIMKKLQDIGLDEAKINMYDIETSTAIRQIADVSHSSIMSQLMLNESDYTDMLAQQKDMLYSLDIKNISLEEENRLLKIELKRLGVDYNNIPKCKSEIVDVEFKDEGSDKTNGQP
ncbi:MAG: hypothetical protein RSC24_06715 [Clostridium sp.]